MWWLSAALASPWVAADVQVLATPAPVRDVVVAPFGARPSLVVLDTEGVEVRSVDGSRRARRAGGGQTLVATDLGGDGRVDVLRCGAFGVHLLPLAGDSIGTPLPLDTDRCSDLRALVDPSGAVLVAMSSGRPRRIAPGASGALEVERLGVKLEAPLLGRAGAQVVMGSQGASNMLVVRRDDRAVAPTGGPLSAIGDADGELTLFAVGGPTPAARLGDDAWPLPRPPTGIATGDLDGDGELDLIAWDDDGWIQPQVDLPPPTRVRVADLDGDACAELVLVVSDTAAVVAGACGASMPPPTANGGTPSRPEASATGDVSDLDDTAMRDTGSPSPTEDTGLADTGIADTGIADTGIADTGIADTGIAEPGPADTGLAPTTDTGVSVDTGLVDTGGPPGNRDAPTHDTAAWPPAAWTEGDRLGPEDLPSPPDHLVLTAQGAWPVVTMFAGGKARMTVSVDGRAWRGRVHGGPPSLRVLERRVLAIDPDAHDIGRWPTSLWLGPGRWTGVIIEVWPRPRPGDPVPVTVSGAPTAARSPRDDPDPAPAPPPDEPTPTARRPWAVARCSLGVGVAAGASQAAGLTWEGLGSATVEATASPAGALICTGHGAVVRWTAGIDAAPWFRYGAAPVDRSHLVSATAGIGFGTAVVHGGPYASLGVTATHLGARLQAWPSGGPWGVEARGAWLAPQRGAQGMVLVLRAL